MTSPESLSAFSRLKDLAKVNSSEERRELLRGITDMFLGNPNTRNETECMLFDEVVGAVVKDMQTSVKAELAEKLSNIFATKTVLDWTRIFWSVGVAVVPNRGIVEVSEDTYARDRGLVMTRDHPAFGSVTHVGAAPRLSATGLVAGESPRFGGDTVPILRELGYTDRDIERIRGQGAIPKSDHIPLV